MKILNNKGQAVVEFALVLPVFLMLLLGMIDFGRVLSEDIIATEAARQGARLAALGASDEEVIATVNSKFTSPVVITISPDKQPGNPVTVTIEENIAIITPGINVFFKDNAYSLKKSLSMRME